MIERELTEVEKAGIRALVQTNAAAPNTDLVEALKKARIELAALVFNPAKPDFSAAVPNEADRDCVSAAYRILTDAINAAAVR